MSDGARPKTGRRREAPDVRREQILDAAEQVLLERGLAAATMADVATAAGIAKGTVYLYFASKTELLEAMRARHVEGFIEALGAALTGTTRAKPLSRLDRFIDEFFEYSVAHHRLYHLLFLEAGISEEDAFADIRRPLGDFIAAGIASGDFVPANVDLLAGFVLSGVHDALLSALHGHGDVRESVAGAKELARRLLVGTK